MKKIARHSYVHFDSPTIRRAIEAIVQIGTELEIMAMTSWGGTEHRPVVPSIGSMEVNGRRESWEFDNLEEFLADLARAKNDPEFIDAYVAVEAVANLDSYIRFTLSQQENHAVVKVEAAERAHIEAVHAVFAEELDRLRQDPPPPPAKPKPRIFIGHGGASTAWRDLLDHLRDHHHLDVVAYETGSRAGHTIRDVLQGMLVESSFAILLMTEEDAMPGPGGESSLRARQNVVHEAGLFQGRLGFGKTLILRERDVEMFSNLDGIQYVPFDQHVRETYGEVLAAIRREFGPF